MIDRRGLIGLALGGVAATPALARQDPAAVDVDDPPPPPWPPREAWPLWPGRPPGAPDGLPTPSLTVHGRIGRRELWQAGIDLPTLNLYRPPSPNGGAILILPGGGYRFLSVTNEGVNVAQRFTALGYTALVLSYRLPAEGWIDRADAPLQDAQRAMRLIRARAADLRIDPGRVAVMGFSAGGHLGASLATGHAERLYAPIDAADALPARPDLAALIYPVIAMDGPTAHAGSRDKLLGSAPTPAWLDRRAPALHVDATTPPTFLVHAIDDQTVPVDNSLAMLAALRARAVAVEAHLFQEGGHGFGVRAPLGSAAAQWPDLAAAWMARALAARPA